MLIADSQVHVWAADRPERPWPPPAHGLKPAPHRAVPISADSLLADMHAAGVDRAILVPPSWEGEIDWLWAAAEAARLPLTIYLPNALIPHIDRAVQRHPALNVIINHFGLTGSARDAAAFADFANLLAMARYPNVAVKASCLPFYSSEAYPYRGLHPYLHQAFDAFGPQRFFWGTDLSRLPGSYRQTVTLFTEELPWLAGANLEWVMGRALCEWLDWERRA